MKKRGVRRDDEIVEFSWRRREDMITDYDRWYLLLEKKDKEGKNLKVLKTHKVEKRGERRKV